MTTWMLVSVRYPHRDLTAITLMAHGLPFLYRPELSSAGGDFVLQRNNESEAEARAWADTVLPWSELVVPLPGRPDETVTPWTP